MRTRRRFQLLVTCTIAAFCLLTALAQKALNHTKFMAEASNKSSTSSNTITATIERMDPALDLIVPAGATLEKLATGFTWTEGPVWIPSGYLPLC